MYMLHGKPGESSKLIASNPQKVGYSGQTRSWASLSNSCRRRAKQYCNQKGQRRQHRRPSHHWQLFSGRLSCSIRICGLSGFRQVGRKGCKRLKERFVLWKWPSVNRYCSKLSWYYFRTIWKYQNYWKPHNHAADAFLPTIVAFSWRQPPADRTTRWLSRSKQWQFEDRAWKLSGVFTSPQLLLDFCFRDHAFIIR